MSDNYTYSRPYGEAAFKIALENNAIDFWSNTLSVLSLVIEDKDIKAILLRIDSGGGSALASDQMWREVMKTTQDDSSNVKPFIASMSDVAASGGYYIYLLCRRIMGAPRTEHIRNSLFRGYFK